MANPAAAAKARLLALPGMAGATVTATPANGVVMAAGNRRAMTATVARIHNDAGGEIETDWALADPADAPWLWAQKTSNLHIFAAPGNPAFNAGQIIRVLHPASGEDITFQPQQIQYTNDLDQISAIADPAATVLTAVADMLEWPAAYGVGIDFEWQSQTERARKVVTFANALPAPPQFIIDGGNPALRVPFAFQVSAAVDVFIDGQLWNKRDTTNTATAVEFQTAGETIFYMEAGRAWDTNDAEAPATMRFRRSGNTRFIEVRVPWSWLETAVYPVYVDPSLSEKVAASADDAYEDSGGNMDISGNGIDLRNTAAWGGFRVALPSDIPNGSTIDSATLDIYIPTSGADDPNWDVYFEDIGNAPAFTTTANDITNRTRTATSYSNTGTNVGTGYYTSGDFTSVLQDLVDSQGGLTSGDYVAPLLDSTGSGFLARTYDFNTTLAPQLDASWTESAAGQFMTTNTGYW